MNKEQEDRITTLFIEMHDMLTTYARTQLKNEELAQEALQEAFLIACKDPTKLLSSPNPKGWMVRTLQIVIKQIIERREQESLLCARIAIFSEDVIFDTATSDIDFEATYSTLLDSQDFELVKYVLVEQHSLREAALQFGISLDACKKRFQRAKKKLLERYRIYFSI